LNFALSATIEQVRMHRLDYYIRETNKKRFERIHDLESIDYIAKAQILVKQSSIEVREFEVEKNR
jgi:hypothetical protein